MLSFASPPCRLSLLLPLPIRLLLTVCGFFLAGHHASAQTAEPIVITFTDLGLERIYTGLDQPHVSWTISPGTPEDYNVKITYNTKAALPKNAGTYTVKVSVTEKTIAPGLKKPRTVSTSGKDKFTVAKAPLTVMAADAGRLFGAANPKFTFSYEGFVNGETFTVLNVKPTATTTARPASPVGDYPINVVGGSDNNYEILNRIPANLQVVAFASGPHEALLLGDFGDSPPGKIEVTLPAKGNVFTGRLHLASLPSPLPFKGNLVLAPDNFSATATVTLQRKPAGALPFRFLIGVTVDALDGLVLTLDRSESPYEFTDPVGTVATSSRVRVHHKTTNPAPWAGAHTLILDRPSDAGDTELRPVPEGASYAAAAIGLDGNLVLRGKLADGTLLTSTLYSDADGAYRVFLRPYGTRLESRLSGRLALIPHPYLIDPQRYQIAGDGSTSLFWLKAPRPGNTRDPLFPAGFGPVSILATLDPWLPPVISKKDPSINFTLAQRLDLAATANETATFDIAYGAAAYGELEFDLPLSATLSPAGIVKPVLLDRNTTAWKMSVNANTGVFTGSFVLKETTPPRSTRTIKFQGILRQGYDDMPSIGAGYALVKPIPGDVFDTETVSASIELAPEGGFDF